ncbi:unnamed protein product [Paramecium sonneborni]|uniref:SP-RING-type domain-containing protein n=1 Tax=Paramecium sonneborni TaxID=65129 RepID=A0A8S1QVL5_9CILI|nr:unnamed protein product [Paramecium sonneborni]
MQQNLEQIYQQLPEANIQTISYDLDLKIINEEDKEKKQYQYPTITKECMHPKDCYELEFIMKEMQAGGAFQCKICKKSATKVEDLVKDLRYRVRIEFNEFVTNIMIIEGKLFNKSSRKKRFLDFFTKIEIRILFKGLFERFVPKEASINQLLIQELRSNSTQRSGTKQRYEFWAFCLQDKVKITIPVRIIGCKHLECYELTSLLLLQQEQQEPFYCCNYPGCDNINKKIDISSIQNLFSKIVIDNDLLQLIKISNPYSMKFVFNYQTQKFEEDVTRQNGKIIDPTIEKYFQKNCQNPKISFENFQQQVFQQLAQVCQNDLFKDSQQQLQQLEKLLRYQKYRNFDVDMKDQLTGMIIEQPVRCKNCKDLSKCLDLKSYCCEFIKTKIESAPTDSFACPLCKTKYQSKILQCSLQNYIYLDQNLLSRIFKELSYRTSFKFTYQGRDYMMQEFQERSKLSKQDYIDDLKAKKQNLNIEFKSITCKLNQNQKLQIPLLIGQCPLKTVIDFSTFYQLLINCEFRLDQGLIVCKCSECNTKPIKQISGNIFFHEAFDHALKQFYKTNSTQTSFSFDFQRDQLTSSFAIPDQQALNIVNMNKRQGFLDMLNDEEYQSVFGQKTFDGKFFQILKIEQNVCDGVSIECNAQGVASNLKEKKDQMNEYAQNNQDLKKWGFKVQTIQIQLHNDQIITNKGVLQE